MVPGVLTHLCSRSVQSAWPIVLLPQLRNLLMGFAIELVNNDWWNEIQDCHHRLFSQAGASNLKICAKTGLLPHSETGQKGFKNAQTCRCCCWVLSKTPPQLSSGYGECQYFNERSLNTLSFWGGEEGWRRTIETLIKDGVTMVTNPEVIVLAAVGINLGLGELALLLVYVYRYKYLRKHKRKLLVRSCDINPV